MNILYDISVPVQPGLVQWPTDPRLEISQFQSIAQGDEANVSALNCPVHTGTHIDAPSHFIEGGKTVDDIPLEWLIGPAQVVNFEGLSEITAADLEQVVLDPGIERLLLKTDNSAHWARPTHDFVKNFVALTKDAAEWVASRGIKLIGNDYLSIQKYDDPPDVHVILLQADVVILEGIDLREVPEGSYQLLCLPLRIQGVEGAGARAVLLANE